ncbi:hypothetical protein L208DRAFT_1137003, partial [Tricholoma matsutake]
GIVSGDVLVKGQPLNSDFAQGMAYGVLLFGFLACLSYAMWFSAYLWQPAHVSTEEKDNYVEEMIEVLELQDL